MIRVCHQPEFLEYAEAIERWAKARERAVTALEERRRAARLREATTAAARSA